MDSSSPQRRLALVESRLITQMIADALARARQGPRADFAATLIRWLPGDAGSVHIDWTLLHDDELVLLAEEPI
jgi:hypothetical protein